jgi:hypothetical protein
VASQKDDIVDTLHDGDMGPCCRVGLRLLRVLILPVPVTHVPAIALTGLPHGWWQRGGGSIKTNKTTSDKSWHFYLEDSRL